MMAMSMRGMTTTACRLGLVALVAALGLSAPPSTADADGAAARPGGPVLTPAAQPGFERLQGLVNDKAVLGEGVRLEGVAIEADRARLSLRQGGHLSTLVLRHAGAGSSAGSYFSISPAAASTATSTDVIKRLPAALAQAFEADPWQQRVAPPQTPRPAEPVPAGPTMLHVLTAMAAILALVALLVWT